MDSNKFYKPDFLPQGMMIGYCSLTVMLGILNYFFGTNFGSKDNFDILSLVKRGRSGTADLIDIDEIALFLDRMYLSCEIFTSMNEEDGKKSFDGTKEEKLAIFKKYTKPEFHHNIQGDKRVFESGMSLDIIDDLLMQRLKQSSVKFSYNVSLANIADNIKQNQGVGVLFVLGLNRSILYNKESNSSDGDGHLVLCTGIDDNNNCIIYEPIDPRPNPHYIPTERVLRAMTDIGSHSMLMIKDNPDHQ